MYGMVNKAIEDLVTINFGADKWEAIKRKAGIEVDAFISNDAYPDCITYGLVTAASEVLDLPVSKILYAFGEFWVLHTARKGYGDLLSAAGRNMPEFLDYLPSFHTRVAKLYETPATVEQTRFKDKGDDHDEFLVCWGAAMRTRFKICRGDRSAHGTAGVPTHADSSRRIIASHLCQLRWNLLCETNTRNVLRNSDTATRRGHSCMLSRTMGWQRIATPAQRRRDSNCCSHLRHRGWMGEARQ